MSTLPDLFKPGSRVIWDGGLGTTLADMYKVETDSPVWSSQVVEDAPETLVDCHLQFLHSGAQVIDTATYQASFSTYAVSNHPVSSATRLMRQSISLAATARTRYLSTTIPHTTTSLPKIALSLGAFGASLVPIAHEFDGVYPPPYGPDPDRDADTPSRVKFTDAETADGLYAASIDALANFHYERLRVFADDAETWSASDLISFETIPLAREVRAVRHAVGRLAESGAERKPWVVSTVWQDGRFPEGGVREIVDAALGEDGSLPVPDGIGVNCTLLGNVRRVVRELGARVSGTGKKPWLALKPNGGKVYDPVARTWSEPTREEGEGTWAEELAEVVREAEKSGSWAGFLVGGCCKTSFDEIRGLRAVL